MSLHANFITIVIQVISIPSVSKGDSEMDWETDMGDGTSICISSFYPNT